VRLPFLNDGDARLYVGDCIEVMAEMDAESVDAVVCDPPYGIGFMGKAWDAAAITERVERDNASRATLGNDSPSRPRRKKPRSSSAYGNRAIAAGPVRDHTLTRARSGSMHAGEYDLSLTANAAFQSWCETWAREALRVLKPGGHLLAFGGTRTYHRLTCGIEDAGFQVRDCLSWLYGSGFPKSLNLDGEWQGWGTALKPGWEPCVVARKPLPGTVAENVQAHGTGAINVDGCRVPTDDVLQTLNGSFSFSGSGGANETGKTITMRSAGLGRWPANVVLDEAAAEMLDAQSGEQRSTPSMRGERHGSIYGGGNGPSGPSTIRGHDDTGGASRFFYTAKASRADRSTNGANNTHPTVKPTNLMRWLIRMVTPPGGVVLDPFAGSGTTLVAARAEGVRCIGIERENEYAQIIVARLSQLSLLSDDHAA
jgi:DNA modification methylase